MKIYKFIFLMMLLLFLTEEVSAQKKTRRKVNKELRSYIEKAPDSLKLDYDWMVKYLKAPVSTDKELVESIYYWIADNIEYDFKAYSSGNYGTQSAAETIIYKKAVCAGYASLFKELCIRAGLECELVVGHGKGIGYQIGEEWEINHAWNAVKVAGDWKLIDVTWGSGGGMKAEDGYRYVKRLDLTYLFADPQDFILTHLPEDSKWQLIENPITREQYFSTDFEVERLNNQFESY